MACRRIIVPFLILATFFSSCITRTKPEGAIADKEKYRQYMASGKKLYEDNCANCHQSDGSGLRRLYPPLKNSDYFKNDRQKILCVIRYGMKGEIRVNGIPFNQEMPLNDQLVNLDLAEISTYVISTFGNVAELITPDDIGNLGRDCLVKKDSLIPGR